MGSRYNTCQKCNESLTLGQPDPCLGYLKGVAHACCGHGNDMSAFCSGFPNCKPDESLTTNGKVRKGAWIKRGKEAIEYMISLRAK